MARDSFRLDGKTAFVSGSRGHLGQAMAGALADAGAHVLVNGRDAAALEAFAQSLRAQGLSAEAVPFDAHDVGRIRGFFGNLPRLDVLVNNIGFMQVKPFGQLEPVDFAATYAATVTTAFESVRAALPGAEARRWRRLATPASINIASMYARVAPDARLYGDPRAAKPLPLRSRQGGPGATHPPSRRRTGACEDPRQRAGARTVSAAGQDAA